MSVGAYWPVGCVCELGQAKLPAQRDIIAAMSPLRVGLVSVLCVSCFNPSGKASESGDTEGTTGGVSATETATMGSASTDVPTSGSMTVPGTGSVTEGETTETGSGSTSGTVTSTTTMDTSSGSEGSSTGNSTGNSTSCGDGIIQPPETCDDGNTNDDDECPGNCLLMCGNGVLNGDEACDDGNVVDNDGCSSTCVRDAAYVFVSSESYEGNLGGVAGADTKCQELADAAKLPGVYQAWLSDETTPAKLRVKPSSFAYVRPDGVPVAKDFNIFSQGQGLAASISVTETKEPIAPIMGCAGTDKVWTGTTALGLSQPGKTCVNWMSVGMGELAAVGDLDEIGAGWTEACGAPCVAMAHLYCLEVLP